MRSSALRLLALVAVSTLVAGCSDSRNATSPANATGPTAERLLLSGPTTVQVVTRDTPLATAQTASATIGLLGGRIVLPGAGLTVVIPPLALGQSTRITVTALAGSKVAYDFQPHGIRFLAPLVVTQKLSGTSAVSGGLLTPTIYAGYFANASDLNQPGATALVSELLSVSLSLVTQSATFPVFHFSGYLVASGINSSDAESWSH